MATVLGVSLGTQNVGIAVITDNRLTDCRIKRFPEKWSKKKILLIVSALREIAAQHHVSVISLKIIHPSLAGKNINRLTGAISAMAEEGRFELETYMIDEIESRICFGERQNTSTLIEKLLCQYPELIVE